ARIFEHTNEQKQQENLGEENQNGRDALPGTINYQRSQPASRQQRTHHCAHPREDIAKAIAQWLADREHHLKDADDYHQEQQWSPKTVEQDVIEPAAILFRKRRAIASSPANLRSPGMRACRIAQH